MIIDNMRFGDYIWPHNPENLSISSLRNVKELSLPFAGSVFQDYGRNKRIVKGTGEFFGEKCSNQFEELFYVYNEGNQNILYIPGIAQFNALFKNLEITCNTIPNLIIYKFEFWEVTEIAYGNENKDKKYHIVKEGENLFSIAKMHEISLATIFKLNPSIKNLNSLDVGKRVILS